MAFAVVVDLPGLPRGKGRPKFRRMGNFVQTYTDEKTQNYEGALRMAGAVAMGNQVPADCALRVVMTATLPVPASWSRLKRSRAMTGRIRPTGKPDCDNIGKCVDALNGIVWRDDAQIVSMTIEKQYGAVPGLRIEIGEVETQ